MRLKKLLAEQLFENDLIKDALRITGERTGASYAGARVDRAWRQRAPRLGGDRHELQCVALLPTPRPQWRNTQAHRCVGPSPSPLWRGDDLSQTAQEGCILNYKRVERLYREQQLQVRRRKRKKVPVGERQPLLRPSQANQLWSMDFVFDRTAEGRVIKCLVIVDDATHEAITIDVERAI